MQKGAIQLILGIVIVVLLVAVGGAYYVGTKQAAAPVAEEDELLPPAEKVVKTETVTPAKVAEPVAPPKAEVKAELTAELIMNSNGFVNGQKGNPEMGTQSIVQIKFGDLDGDSKSEAVAVLRSCGASCGSSVLIFKLIQDKVVHFGLPGTSVFGALGSINSYDIKNGRVEITLTDGQGTRFNGYKIAFGGGQLRVVDLDYAKVLESSARQAVIKFSIPMMIDTFSKETVKLCVVSGSAGTMGNDDCSNKNFSLAYDPATMILTVIDTFNHSASQPDFGAFRIGCAACTSQVKFIGLEARGGGILPTKQVVVY